MGKQYKTNQKRVLGKPNIVGQDVVTFSQTVASGIVGGTSLTTQAGTSKVTLPRDGVMQFLTSDVGEALGTGQLNVQLKKNGTVVASGTHDSSSGALLEWVFGDNQNYAKHTVASGDYLEADYSVDSIISHGVAATPNLLKVGLLYLE